MVRMLKAVVLFLIIFSTVSLAQDPGDPDQVVIGIDGIGPGEVARIPVSISCDSDVGQFTIPIAYDDLNLSYDSAQFYGTVLLWDDVSVQERVGMGIATIIGWADLFGDPNPPLNSGGELEVVADLFFSGLPGAPVGNYPLEITVDPLIGALEFGNMGGSAWWTPQYQEGFIQVSDEFGFIDSLFISCDSAVAGEQVTVQVSVFNDEDVEGVVIPISFDNSNFYYVGRQFYGDVLGWDDISVVINPESTMVTIVGFANLGGAPNPRLNNEGVESVIAELYFASNPDAVEGYYPFNDTTDPVNGPLLFWDSTGTIGWTPPHEDGCVYLTQPPSCDMTFNYLFAYGFCQSPWEDRQYASTIRNLGGIPAENVTLEITTPPEFVYQYSNPQGSFANGVITWSAGTLAPGESFHVDWYMDIPPGLDTIPVYTIGDISTTTYDINPANNHNVFEEIVGFSYDPNDKEVNPPGVTANHFVTGEQAFQYKVYFENDSSATLPATFVTITDTLDNNLNWSSFSLAGMSHPGPCDAYIDPGTGIVTLDCDSIYLQPDSEGFFTFTVEPKWNLTTGAVIENQAWIVFDFNDPIAAPEDSPVFNKLDKTMPLSNVVALPDTTLETSFEVSWVSNDGAGSGVAYHDIYVSDSGAPYSLWLDDVDYFSDTFVGERDHLYSFYSIATDFVGIEETAPPQPDAEVFIKPLATYAVGDVNGSGNFNGLDITYGVAYLKGGSEPQCGDLVCPPHSPFWVCGDVNGSCSYNGLDITYGVAYLKGGAGLMPCGDCPPSP